MTYQITADLTSAKTAHLVALYNEQAEAKVKKFESRDTAIDRLIRLAELRNYDLVVRDGEIVWSLPEGSLETDENEDADGTKLPEEKAPEEKAPEAPAHTGLAASLKPKTEGKAKRGPAPQHADDHVITVVSETNPKRANTASHARFALYKTGMTVLDYLTAAHELQGGSNPEKFRSDLIWDTDKSFIRVGPKAD